MGLSSITPFRQLSRAYSALLVASNSLSLIAHRKQESDPAVVLNRSTADIDSLKDQLAVLASKLEAFSTSIGQGNATTADSPQQLPPQTAFDFNVVLHQGRSVLMRDMPPNAECVVSAGCSGRLYFDWVEKTYGYVRQHIGIEYYLPKPDALPDNVTWIENTAGNMEAVADKSCDLLISGQNIEHLWPEDVVGFLMESARVLKTGGTLCVDSPNRVVTQMLNWTHPEHTIELTVPEMKRLLALAGFEITKEAGIWLCQDPKTGRALPIDPNTADPEWSVTERILSATDKPEYSFLWWIESRRTERRPDREALREYLDSVYAVAWPERTQRLIVGPGLTTEQRADGEWILVPLRYDGVVFFGPYMPLQGGRYRITFEFEPGVPVGASFARCDVAFGPEGKVLAEQEVLPGQTKATFELELPQLTFGAQFRCYGVGRAAFAVRRHIGLEELGNEVDAATAGSVGL